MWFESALQVGDEPVGLSVQRLDDERDSTAATPAWLALEIFRCCTGGQRN
jgi:hypothetical protein